MKFAVFYKDRLAREDHRERRELEIVAFVKVVSAARSGEVIGA